MRGYFIFFIFIFLSCNDSTPNSDQSDSVPWAVELKSVMAIHDEVMPFMTEMNQLKTVLTTYQSKQKNLPKDQGELLTNVINQLSKADEGMWDWMHGFVQPNGTDDPKKVSIYLANEQKKINMVNQNMKSSMTAAKKLIGELKI